MNLGTLAFWLEPAAALGAGVAILAGLGVVWHYRNNQSIGLKWYLKNWRLMQVLGVTGLYYLALAATCAVLGDRWGWLYLFVAIKAGIWWVTRLMRVQWGLEYLLRSDVQA